MKLSFNWKNNTTGKTINKEFNVSKKVGIATAIVATTIAIGGTIALAVLAAQGK